MSGLIYVRVAFIQHLGPWARIRPCRVDMNDVDKQDELWAWFEGEIKKHAPLP